jgi:putative transcriptional regulator
LRTAPVGAQGQGPRRVNFNGTVNLATEDRPIDALLAAYAAKTLSAPLAALMAAHLELKPDNRAYVAALEAAHGIFLEELKPVPLAGRDRRLVNIFATASPDAAPVVTRLLDDTEAVLPRALRRLAGCDDAGLPWRRRSAGLKEAVAAQRDGDVARFICLQPGRRLPALGGESPAVVLVIAGALTDRNGYHEHGDIVFAGRDAELVAEGDVDCVCFVATEDAAKPSGALSRILWRVMGG